MSHNSEYSQKGRHTYQNSIKKTKRTMDSFFKIKYEDLKSFIAIIINFYLYFLCTDTVYDKLWISHLNPSMIES